MASFKRIRQQPHISTQSLLDYDLGESSSDSDFRIEDHKSSDDEDCSSKEDQDESSDLDDSTDDDDNDSESYDSTQQLKQLLASDVDAQTNGGDDLEAMLKHLDSKHNKTPKLPTKPICCVCLGDRSDDSNEIVECDGCSVSVHEGCYGVSDNASISSTNSTCSTEPWFCEACRVGVSEPVCELCPNKGGIYKETDVGKWVHLVCALYVPGVAFGEVDQLSSVTLFEMQYSKWGAKLCTLCENSRFARTGVCIGCDAGMCKTYFHVTCAQTAGFLTEAHHEEAEAADPFYAHCKLHSDKEMIKKRKRNFHTFRLYMQQKQKEKLALRLEDPCPAQMRIQRKLLKYQRKYSCQKQLKCNPWVPTQKMSRLLTTSASACKRLLAKAQIMAVDVELLERQEAQIAELTDIRKKWHIPPAFSVEFIGYYLDRIPRCVEIKQQISVMMAHHAGLTKDQEAFSKKYDGVLEKNKEAKRKQENLNKLFEMLHRTILSLYPSKSLPSLAQIGHSQQEPVKTSTTPPTRPISVPTAAALKMGVGFPLAHLGPPGTKVDSTRLLSTHANHSPNANAAISNTLVVTSAPVTPTLDVQSHECGICKRCTDQHLLAKCDTCQLYYHLGCLNPPLTRHPKKSKLYGWQCSECDKSDESDAVAEVPKGPRKSRTRFNKDGSIVLVDLEKEAYPPKRRLTDVPINTTKEVYTKKELVKSSPTAVDTNASSALKCNSLTVTTPKKSKLYSNTIPAPTIVEKSISPTKLTPTYPKKIKSGAPPQPPIHAALSANESLLLVLPETTTLSMADQSSEHDPLALPVSDGGATVVMLDDLADPCKQARKQKRKDKHRNKHLLSSDTEKSPNKEHKRKRKKKMHDLENPNDGTKKIPKIKIKFKTLPLPGEVTPEAQFFYVSADMVRSAEEASRPTSVETVEELTPQHSQLSSSPSKLSLTPSTPKVAKSTPSPRKSSPRKVVQNTRSFSAGRPRSAISQTAQNLTCCVCCQIGTPTHAVTCDECSKHYHFTCLDPPLKKTPKIRGYSWHCADCDPTDSEDKK